MSQLIGIASNSFYQTVLTYRKSNPGLGRSYLLAKSIHGHRNVSASKIDPPLVNLCSGFGCVCVCVRPHYEWNYDVIKLTMPVSLREPDLFYCEYSCI